jgi:hypothetical protein
VLSRNLTADRSWDLSLQLEGEVRRTGRYVAANRELGELIRDLPAMAAGLTDHTWSLREVLLFRVPPWPQPAEV